MGRRGPAPKGVYSGKSKVLSTRIRPDTRARLEAAKAESKRSLSQEIEYRLHRTFIEDEKIEVVFGSRQVFGLMKLIASVINLPTNLKNRNATWLNDPYLFDQAFGGVITVLKAIRPAGDHPRTTEDYFARGGRKQGKATALVALHEVQVADPAPSLVASKHKQKLAMLKVDLGEIADRPKLFGEAAEETRRRANLWRELAPLRKKSNRQPNLMTNEEVRRKEALERELGFLPNDLKPARPDGRRMK
jgi:hypothetical protein